MGYFKFKTACDLTLRMSNETHIYSLHANFGQATQQTSIKVLTDNQLSSLWLTSSKIVKDPGTTSGHSKLWQLFDVEAKTWQFPDILTNCLHLLGAFDQGIIKIKINQQLIIKILENRQSKSFKITLFVGASEQRNTSPSK